VGKDKNDKRRNLPARREETPRFPQAAFHPILLKRAQKIRAQYRQPSQNIGTETQQAYVTTLLLLRVARRIGFHHFRPENRVGFGSTKGYELAIKSKYKYGLLPYLSEILPY